MECHKQPHGQVPLHITLLDVFLVVSLRNKQNLFLMGTEEVYDAVVADSLQKKSGMFVTWKCEGMHYYNCSMLECEIEF